MARNYIANGVKHSAVVACPECGHGFLERGLGRHRTSAHGVARTTKPHKETASERYARWAREAAERGEV